MSLKRDAFSPRRNTGSDRGSKYQDEQDSGARENPAEKSRKKNAGNMPQGMRKHGLRHEKTPLNVFLPYS